MHKNIPIEYRDKNGNLGWSPLGSEKVVRDRIENALKEAKVPVVNRASYRVTCLDRLTSNGRQYFTRVTVSWYNWNMSYRRARTDKILSSKANEAIDLAAVVSLIEEFTMAEMGATARRAGKDAALRDSKELAAKICAEDGVATFRNIAVSESEDGAEMVTITYKKSVTAKEARRIIKGIMKIEHGAA